MPSIHIGTFNIFQSRAPHAVRDLIKKYDLAVVALQEVDVNAERSNRLYVPEVIADGTYSCFSRSVIFGKQGAPMIPPTGRASDEEFGVACVSKFPIKSSASVALGPSEAEYWKDASDFEREPRTALLAQIEILGVDIWIITTHLAYTKDRDQPSLIRCAQVEKMMEFIGTHVPPRAPTILMGDWNATPGNPDLADVFHQFKSVAMHEPTYPIRVGDIPRWQIDHIFFRNFDTSTITIGPMRTYCDPAISDHALCMTSLTQ